MNWRSRPPAASRPTDPALFAPAQQRGSEASMPDQKATADPIDARLVRRLAAILNDTGLTEIEVERGELRIKVARNVGGPAAAPTYYAAPAAPAPAGGASAPGASPAQHDGDIANPPMV